MSSSERGEQSKRLVKGERLARGNRLAGYGSQKSTSYGIGRDVPSISPLELRPFRIGTESLSTRYPR